MKLKVDWVILSGIAITTSMALLFDRDVFALRTPFGRLTPSDIAMTATILLCCFLPRKRMERIDLPTRIIVGAAFLYVLTGLATVYVRELQGSLPNLGTALGDTLRYFLYAIYVGVVSLRLNQTRTRHYLGVWLICSAIVLLVAVGQILYVLQISSIFNIFAWENIRGQEQRIAATFRWQGPFVAFIGLTLPILLTLAVKAPQRRKRPFYLIFTNIALFSVLFSGSRSSLLVLPLSFISLLASFPSWQRLIIAPALALITAWSFVLLVTQASNLPRAVARVIGTGNLLQHMIDESRLRIWSEGLFLWQQSPLFGIGPLQLEEYIGYRSHNSYLATLIERGLIGMCALTVLIGGFLLLLVSLLRCKDARIRPICIAFAAGICNFLLYAMTATGLEYRMFWVYLPMALSYARQAHTGVSVPGRVSQVSVGMMDVTQEVPPAVLTSAPASRRWSRDPSGGLASLDRRLNWPRSHVKKSL